MAVFATLYLASCGSVPASPHELPTVRVEPTTVAALSEHPEPDIVLEWDFRAGKALGWKSTHHLRDFKLDDEGLHTASIGGDPYMVGPVSEVDTSVGYYIAVHMRSTLGSDAQLFWVTKESSTYDEAKSLHFTPKPDGRWHTYVIPVHKNPTWSGTVRQLRLDPSAQEGSDISIAWIRVLGQQPGYLEIVNFGATVAVVEADTPFEIRARIANVGDRATEATTLTLVLPEALSLGDGEVDVAVGAVDASAEKVLSWTATASPGVHELLLMDSGTVVERTLTVVAEMHGPPRALENGALRLSFPRQPYGYGVAALSLDEEPLGRLQSLGSLIYLVSDGSEHSVLLFAEDVVEVEGGLRMPFTFQDVEGVEWWGESLILIASDGTGYDISMSIQAGEDVEIINWTGLALYAGDGGFGPAKESALFPGLEFLLDEEESSSTHFFNPPGHRRYVPHPLKVTIPLMAVTYNNSTVGLTWDPVRSWDGHYDRPGALFASPNTWDGQDNQMMALFVPGPVLDGEENSVRAATPYALAAGHTLSLAARLFVVPAEDALAPITYWMRTYGLPSLPALPRTYEEGIRLSLDSTMGPTWNSEARGWHYALQDPWGPGASPANQLHLWLAALRGDLAPEEQAQYRDLVRELSRRTDYVGGQPNPALYIPALSMHLAAGDTLFHLAQLGRERRVGQNPAGFWPYVPQAGSGRPFGEAGDTSSGQVAARALYLLRFARLTGDADLRQAGLRALSYMEAHQSRRPEGAQIWELPLRCPDLLAAAWAQQSYLEAYRLTGDPHYAEQAQWWAVSGLPFIYLWSTPDREIMAYTTVPVFAATNYTYSWLGRPVMWNGLDYAFGLWHFNDILAEAGVDPFVDWRQVAEGITRASMQMQPEDGPFQGMYPDAWDVVTGSDAYSWWLHPFYILQNLYVMEGAGADVHTVILRDEVPAIHVSAVADILRAERQAGRTEIELGYYEGETTVLMLAQAALPAVGVEINGVGVPEIDSLENHPVGWRYHGSTLLVKIPFVGERAVVVIE